METKTVQKLGLLCASIALCSAASWWNGSQEAEQQMRRIAELPPAVLEKPLMVTVCVSGAVHKPGMYQVPKGNRAEQVIRLAGGVTEEADMDRVNLAQLCKDGGHIKVPRLSQGRTRRKTAGGENGKGRAEKPREKTGKNDTGSRREKNLGTVRLNSAGEAELQRLPGVGKSTARQIIAYRRRHGFQRIEDIMRVPGIGPARFKKIRDSLAL